MTPRPRSYEGARPGGRRPARSNGRSRPAGARRDSRHPSRKRRDPLWAKLVIVFGALVMLGSGLTVIGPKLVSRWFFKDVTTFDTFDETVHGESLEGAINFLLIGTDSSLEQNIETRTDSIVLVHIPATHDQAYMISFPRDLEVDIPAADFPNGSTGVSAWSDQKLNVAFQTGARQLLAPGQGGWGPPDYSPEGVGRGVTQVMRTLSNLVPGGLEFHGAALIDFSGFDKVVEAIGGVRICVDFGGLVDSDDKTGKNEEIWSIHRFADGSKLPHNMSATAYNNYGGPAERSTRPQRAHYREGCQELKPWQALDLSRQRVQFSNGDYGRHMMQQQLIKGIIAKVASPNTLTNLTTIRNLQQAAGGLLTLALGGHSPEDWVLTARNLRPDSVVGIKFNGGRTCSETVTVPNNQCMYPESQRLLQAVQNDTLFAFLAEHPDWEG